MAEIIVNESVVNQVYGIGTIVSFDGKCIIVKFADILKPFPQNAFDTGFLKYESAQLQQEVEESVAQAKIEAAKRSEEKRIAEAKAREAQKQAQAQAKQARTEIRFESVAVRLDAAPVTMNTIRKKDKPRVQAIFAECDKDTQALYDRFNPNMEYLRYTTQARSKYRVGFLTKYLDTYVFRVFSREDIYKKRMRTGVTVMKSDTTEILRVLYINDKIYYFSKNISTAMNSLTHTDAYPNWHCSVMAYAILLNEVIRCCDCGYLNDHIATNNVGCLQYLKLLMVALHNNKVEIAFKHGRFASTYRIQNLADYLKDFSSKQIDFACKHDVINTLPIIKRHGLYDVDILTKLEPFMEHQLWCGSGYSRLEYRFQRLGFDLSELDRKLILFLRRIDHFNAAIYTDYITALSRIPTVTIDDFFDNNYIERHTILSREKKSCDDEAINAEYVKIAKTLSWIDREDNGYYISVPKNLEEFRNEGSAQHNCVYTNRYYDKVIRNQSIIVFLRKDKYNAYVTIEYDYETFSVRQALGKYNSRIDPALYQYIVDLGKQLHYEMLTQ